MIVAVSANGEGLEAPISPIFGRCPVYVIVDTDTWAARSLPNPAASASGGAGIQAAQFVIDQCVQALVAGNVGPNAMQVLQASGIAVYTYAGGTVQEAVEALLAGDLARTTQATTGIHAGMPGMGAGRRGAGGGGGAGRGGGIGGGRGGRAG